MVRTRIRASRHISRISLEPMRHHPLPRTSLRKNRQSPKSSRNPRNNPQTIPQLYLHARRLPSKHQIRKITLPSSIPLQRITIPSSKVQARKQHIFINIQPTKKRTSTTMNVRLFYAQISHITYENKHKHYNPSTKAPTPQ